MRECCLVPQRRRAQGSRPRSGPAALLSAAPSSQGPCAPSHHNQPSSYLLWNHTDGKVLSGFSSSSHFCPGDKRKKGEELVTPHREQFSELQSSWRGMLVLYYGLFKLPSRGGDICGFVVGILEVFFWLKFVSVLQAGTLFPPHFWTPVGRTDARRKLSNQQRAETYDLNYCVEPPRQGDREQHVLQCMCKCTQECPCHAALQAHFSPSDDRFWNILIFQRGRGDSGEPRLPGELMT